MPDPSWTFTVKIAAPTKDWRHLESREYTPKSGDVVGAADAAYYLTRALIDFREFPEDDEGALNARLRSLIESIEDSATWNENAAEVTVRRVR
ncbi:MAG: hypothetical protein WAV90_23020 [Gordonia amarae]